MKEFAVYTLLRLGLFLATLAIVVAIWGLFTDAVPVLWAAILAFLISGLASLLVLNRPREAFAAKVERGAAKVSDKIEAQRSKEDAD